jgi:hypothetical protein
MDANSTFADARRGYHPDLLDRSSAIEERSHLMNWDAGFHR